MAMKEEHTPVRIKLSIYVEIKELAESLGMTTKKCVELLLRKAMEDIKKTDTLSLTISKDKSGHTMSIK